MTDKLISVIVPVYNVEKYLDRCVSSILSQTYENIEVILVDNSSLDRCPEMCERWAEVDSRVRVFHTDDNLGIGPARNIGIDAARGELLMFVDSDDFMPYDAAEQLLNRLLKDESDMAIGKHTDYFDDGSVNGNYCSWMKDTVLSRDDVFAMEAGERRIPVSAWGKLFRRHLFTGNDFSGLRCGEDLMLFGTLVERSSRISIVDKLVYYYYQRNESVTHKPSETSRLDEISAMIFYGRLLYDGGYEASARRRFNIAVSKSLLLEKRSGGRRLIKGLFTKQMRDRLMAGAGNAARMKWFCLHVPILFDMIQYSKRLFRR